MTSRERVLAAVRHQQPDRCPLDFGGMPFTLSHPKVLQSLRDLLGLPMPDDRDPNEQWPEEAVLKHLDVDMRYVPSGPPDAILRHYDPAGYEERLAQRARKKPEKRHVVTASGQHIHRDLGIADLTLEEIRKLKPKLPDPPKYMDWAIAQAKEFRAQGKAVSYFVCSGFFELGCWGRGYEQFVVEMMTEPDLVRALFDLWLAEKLHLVRTVVRPLAPHIDLFVFGDDLALQTGPFFSPEVFRAMLKPYFTELYGAMHKTAPQSAVVHHSCGSVYRLLDDLIDMGVDVLNPLQPNAADMSPEKLKPAGAGRLCFHGGIDLQDLLPHGTPEMVRAEAARRMRILGQGGGYLCAPAHSLPEDVPAENIVALCQADRSLN